MIQHVLNSTYAEFNICELLQSGLLCLCIYIRTCVCQCVCDIILCCGFGTHVPNPQQEGDELLMVDGRPCPADGSLEDIMRLITGPPGPPIYIISY